jgi:hypothetical protein
MNFEIGQRVIVKNTNLEKSNRTVGVCKSMLSMRRYKYIIKERKISKNGRSKGQPIYKLGGWWFHENDLLSEEDSQKEYKTDPQYFNPDNLII